MEIPVLRYIRGTTGLCRLLGSPAIALVEANQIPIKECLTKYCASPPEPFV